MYHMHLRSPIIGKSDYNTFPINDINNIPTQSLRKNRDDYYILVIKDMHIKYDNSHKIHIPCKEDIDKAVVYIKNTFPNIQTIRIHGNKLHYRFEKPGRISLDNMLLYLLENLITPKITRLSIRDFYIYEGDEINYKHLNSIISKNNIQYLHLYDFDSKQINDTICDTNIIGLDLHMMSNRFNYEIIHALGKLPLLYLNISYFDGNCSMENFLRYNTTLKELTINVNTAQEIRHLLGDSLKYNTTLKTLDLTYNMPEDENEVVPYIYEHNIGLMRLYIHALYIQLSGPPLLYTPVSEQCFTNRPFIDFTANKKPQHNLYSYAIYNALTQTHFLIRMVHFIVCKVYKLPHFVKLLICCDTCFTDLENVAMANYFLEQINTNMSIETAWMQFLKIKRDLQLKAISENTGENLPQKKTKIF